MSANDMAQYSIKRPKTDEEPAATPAVPAPANPLPTNPSVQPASVAASSATQPQAQAPPPAAPNVAVPAASSASTAPSTAPSTPGDNGTAVDTIAPPATPLPVTERRKRTIDNLNRIAKAMEAYRNEKGRYPLNAIYTYDGQPLLSWRIELLPYLGYQALYDKFNKSESCCIQVTRCSAAPVDYTKSPAFRPS